jgi:flavorubredoxin
MISSPDSRTRIDEIGDGIFRISTPVTAVPVGFTFNQFLIVDDEPLLFHTGLRQLFPLVREAIDTVIQVERLRYISFSHYEADECGSLNGNTKYVDTTINATGIKKNGVLLPSFLICTRDTK